MTLSARFDTALIEASALHRKQARKTSGAPYIAHLLGVASLVLEDGGSEDECIAALLHDSVEDQGTRFPGGPAALLAKIRRDFGDEVARLVDALTERPSPEIQQIADKRERWRAHKQKYISLIPSFDSSVRRISCADSLYNVRSLITGYRSLGERLWARFMTRQAADQLWAYSEISRAFVQAAGGSLAADLEDSVNQLHSLTGFTRGQEFTNS